MDHPLTVEDVGYRALTPGLTAEQFEVLVARILSTTRMQEPAAAFNSAI